MDVLLALDVILDGDASAADDDVRSKLRRVGGTTGRRAYRCFTDASVLAAEAIDDAVLAITATSSCCHAFSLSSCNVVS